MSTTSTSSSTTSTTTTSTSTTSTSTTVTLPPHIDIILLSEEVEIKLKVDGDVVDRRPIFSIKVANYGMDRFFRLKDYDRSTAAGYTVALTVWHVVAGVITKIPDAGSCTATRNGPDTVITYVPADVFDTVGDYLAEFGFTKDEFVEDSGTIAWRVLPSSR